MQSRQPYFHDVPAWHWLDSGIGWTITKISSHHCDILKSLSSNDAPPHPFESRYESHTLTLNSSSMLPKYHKPIRWFNRTNYYPIMIQPKRTVWKYDRPQIPWVSHHFPGIFSQDTEPSPTPGAGIVWTPGRLWSRNISMDPRIQYRMDTWYIQNTHSSHIWILHDPIQICHGYPSLAF